MAVSSRWAHGSPVLCLSAGTVPGCKLPVPGWGQAPLQLHSSWLQAVEQLNIKAKNFRDLLTDEPFSRQDIITLQVCVPSPCCSQEGPPESLGSAPLGHPTSPPSLGGFLPATYLVAVPQLLPTVFLPPASCLLPLGRMGLCTHCFPSLVLAYPPLQPVPAVSGPLLSVPGAISASEWPLFRPGSPPTLLRVGVGVCSAPQCWAQDTPEGVREPWVS